MQEYDFGYDSTIVSFSKDKSIVGYNYLEHSFEVPSKEIYNLIRDWHEKIIKWKNEIHA